MMQTRVLALLASILCCASLKAPSTLVVQNKGGGHGELGYHIAKQLSDLGHDVTLLQDSSCSKEKQPFASYSSLPSNVKVQMQDFSDFKAPLEGGSFDYIVDNYSKDESSDASKALLEMASASSMQKYVYVSSAGLYKPEAPFGGDDSGPLLEDMPVKDAGQARFEKEFASLNVPFFSFRPQYIYGKLANKFSYIDYFFDRIVNDKPLPIPNSGEQKVSLTNAADVASLLVCCVKSDGPAGVYNCGTNAVLSYNELSDLCAKVASAKLGRSVSANVVRFDSSKVGKGAFPFRENSFYVKPTKAMDKLGWDNGSCKLEEDLKWYFEDYLKRNPSPDFSKDEEVLQSVTA